MVKKFNVLTYAIILGFILYMLDAFIFYVAFGKDYTFLQALLTKVPISEVYDRLLMVTGVIIFGIIIYGKTRELSSENKFLHQQLLNISQGHFDSNFLSSLSYQIRIPLNAIIGFSELLKNPNLSPESKEIYLNHINSSSKYLFLLINNISDISKIESNELTINRTESNINKILEDLFQVYQLRKKELGKSNIPLVIVKERKEENFSILTDPERLKHVLNILLENAFINTDEGMVKLGYTLRENKFVEFYIKDTGHGFSKERLEAIFNRYNKLSDNQNLPFDGSVLRLAISKSLVKLLGGEIWVETKLGQGSTFYFTIPFIEVPKPKEDKTALKLTLKERDWSGRQILIAEDVESNYIYLEELLRPTRISVLWAKNGLEAVDIIKTNSKIELVLMDILMPEMDGYVASKEIKKIRKDLPIVAQTAYSVDDNWKNEENKYFDSYLIKPIWAPQLISSIDNYIY